MPRLFVARQTEVTMDEDVTTLSFTDWLNAIFKEMSFGDDQEMFPHFGGSSALRVMGARCRVD